MSTINEYKNTIDEKLILNLDLVTLGDLRESMGYSLKNGGKRIRPTLLIATYEAFSLDLDIAEVMPYAVALEYIHTYSLIHDDLPAMDNDDYRRGKLTSHKVFGEANAILAGDALLNTAFEIMAINLGVIAEKNKKNGKKLKNHIKAMNIITKASGANGMIQGQILDMKYENNELKDNVNLEVLQNIHKHKTGDLIKASIMAGITLSSDNINIDKKNNVEKLSEYLGVAFQIQDDILDCTSTFEKLGKPINSDIKNKKTTYVSLFGIDEAKNVYNEYKEKIIYLINKLDIANSNFEKIILEILNREN